MRQPALYATAGVLAVLVIGVAAYVILKAGWRRAGDSAIAQAQTVAASEDVPKERAPAQPTPPPRKVLVSRLAGSWYAADPGRLRQDIEAFLRNVSGATLENVQALILPHAAYAYSGQVAAYGVAQVAGKSYSRVVILGPTHRFPLENAASVPDATHYATPLGEVPLDTPFITALLEHPCFRIMPEVDEAEHSVQIEIPLLQQALGAFSLVPIVVGQLDTETTREIAKALLGLVDNRTLVVASSDFTHYGSRFGYVPFREQIPENLEKLDRGAFAYIERKDLDGFEKHVRDTQATICGHDPIGVLLAMLPSDSEAHLLKYDTSGRITGEFDNSVSYVAAAFTGTWTKTAAAEAEGARLSKEEELTLLKLARATLSYAVEKSSAPTIEELGIEPTAAMKETGAAFVTLTKHGQLRGCIGDIEPHQPLYKSIVTNAIGAGLRDPRFPPVNRSELSELQFEISVLTQPKPVASYKDIVVGRDGIILAKGFHRAVFLPQVAPEQGWTLEETLQHLSLKAGLPKDAWQEGAAFSVFQAEVFSEEAE